MLRTEQFPLAVLFVRANVDRMSQRCQVNLRAVVSPRAKLHRAVLIVKRKPRDVDGTAGDVETQWNPGTSAVRVDDDVSRKLAVNVLVSTAVYTIAHSPYHNPHNASVIACLPVPFPAERTQILCRPICMFLR